MDKQAKIYVAGHRGMVGSALVRRLAAGGYSNVLTRSRAELDLLNQAATLAFLQKEKPDFIFMAAAKVGGIHANNSLRADFIYQNLMVEANLIHGAHGWPESSACASSDRAASTRATARSRSRKTTC
jgi:GDP-L-fucose synthase